MAMKQAKPLYRQIYEFLYENICADTFKKGRLPTDGQLMRKFATTRATVAKAMRELEMAGLIERRPGAGTVVRPAIKTHGAFVSTLIAGLGDTAFFEPICAQIAQSCHACNLNLLWGPDSHSTALTRDASVAHVIEHFHRQNVKGVFFAPDEGVDAVTFRRNQQIAERLTHSGIAVVLLDRDVVAFPEQGAYDLVGIDNMNAGFQQVKHLVEMGCTRIAYVTRPGQLWTKDARLFGFKLAIEQFKLDRTACPVFCGDVADVRFCETILKSNPDGIACFHDPIAVVLVQHLRQRHIAVPQRVKLIGLDDVSYSSFLPIPITTLRQPCRSIGAQAAELMALRINNDQHPPRRILFDTQLIVRASSLKKDE